MDVFFALIGLALTGPFLLIAWILIKWDDGGPGFYLQERVGRHGRPFRIIKLRTMSMGADKRGPSITVAGDNRITRAGHWLRKAKLDEMPQLWNILRGDMSFVGPRPEVSRYVSLYTVQQREVLELRPGLTDEASIEFRDEESLLAVATEPEKFYIEHCLPRKIAINLAYAQRANVFRDVGVIFRTIGAVWLHRHT